MSTQQVDAAPTLGERLRDPAYSAYLALRTVFTIAPILFGLDKFFNWMTFWPNYLWVGFPHLFSVSPQTFMYGVGVIEMVAGLMRKASTRTGLSVVVDILDKVYELGRKVSRAAKDAVNLVRDTVLPRWNYRILPNV